MPTVARKKKPYHEVVGENMRGLGAKQQEPQAATSDLEDREVQDDIMDPKGAELKLSYTTLRTYPLTMFMRRRAAGLLTRVLADTAGAGARSRDEMKLRIVSLLNSRADLELSLFEMVAVAVHQPGLIRAMDDPKIAPCVEELQNKADSSDVVILFSRISELSGFQDLKNAPSPATGRK